MTNKEIEKIVEYHIHQLDDPWMNFFILFTMLIHKLYMDILWRITPVITPHTPDRGRPRGAHTFLLLFRPFGLFDSCYRLDVGQMHVASSFIRLNKLGTIARSVWWKKKERKNIEKRNMEEKEEKYRKRKYRIGKDRKEKCRKEKK